MGWYFIPHFFTKIQLIQRRDPILSDWSDHQTLRGKYLRKLEESICANSADSSPFLLNRPKLWQKTSVSKYLNSQLWSQNRTHQKLFPKRLASKFQSLNLWKSEKILWNPSDSLLLSDVQKINFLHMLHVKGHNW